MARTHGHGNPTWTRDETILALDLYFESDKRLPSPTDHRVLKLSNLLRSLPHHESASKNDSFRNPDGVAFKLQNLHNVATGKGLSNVSEMDRQIWAEFRSRRADVRALAELILTGIQITAGLKKPVDPFDDEEFYEGRILSELHKRRERDPRIRKRLLDSRLARGRLTCDLCCRHSIVDNSVFEDAIFEAHHTVPLSMASVRVTRIADLSLLCANCHRLVHRAISTHKRWLSITECQQLLASSPSKL
jgi:5-methylcytosine-specific restriction protein A